MTEDGTWHIWVDTGGTFTDCLARNPDGRIERFKTLSSGDSERGLWLSRAGKFSSNSTLRSLPAFCMELS